MFKLLTRDQFRNSVFTRDSNLCVVCKASSKDAHHIMERKLFSDGGYYLENGASVCEEHHLQAESTELSCEKLRELIGITKFPLPEHLYRDQIYDKWGNPILPNGQRLKGELFNDVSVQKIIQPYLSLFTDKVKYPRTFHLPWSPGVTKDDRIQNDLSNFENKRVIVTVKCDGENTSLYHNYMHARSIDYEPHPSRSMIKAMHANMSFNIPEGWRVCGENLYAKHSIEYNNLDDYFLVYSIWNEKNICLNWDDTVTYSNVLGLKNVPVIYDGIWDLELIKDIYPETYNGDICEGYVVRLADEYSYSEFKKSCLKYVRANHVQTHGHWIRQEIKVNKLKC